MNDRRQVRHKYGIHKRTANRVHELFENDNTPRSARVVFETIPLKLKSSAVSILHYMDHSDEFEVVESYPDKWNRVGTTLFRLVVT